jgi:hypothetical protein
MVITYRSMMSPRYLQPKVFLRFLYKDAAKQERRKGIQKGKGR